MPEFFLRKIEILRKLVIMKTLKHRKKEKGAGMT
jgi:hypothetical protein